MKNEPWQRRLERAGLSQRELARLLGKSQDTISRQLTGKAAMTGYVANFIRAWEWLPQQARDELWSLGDNLEDETAQNYEWVEFIKRGDEVEAGGISILQVVGRVPKKRVTDQSANISIENVHDYLNTPGIDQFIAIGALEAFLVEHPEIGPDVIKSIRGHLDALRRPLLKTSTPAQKHERQRRSRAKGKYNTP